MTTFVTFFYVGSVVKKVMAASGFLLSFLFVFFFFFFGPFGLVH
jgi:hypothetical protein